MSCSECSAHPVCIEDFGTDKCILRLIKEDKPLGKLLLKYENKIKELKRLNEIRRGNIKFYIEMINTLKKDVHNAKSLIQDNAELIKNLENQNKLMKSKLISLI